MNRWGPITAIGIVLWAGSVAPVHSAWVYKYRKPITIDNIRVTGSADLLDFPVFISVVDPDLRTLANGGHVENASGYDIIFRGADGVTNLAFEVERYDGATGAFDAWVRVPVLDFDDDTGLFVYYGNTDVGSPQDSAAAVWDASFLGVWHLNETAGATIADSTANGRDGTMSATVGSGPDPNAASLISVGQDFVRTEGDKVELFGTGSTLSLVEFTAETWVRTPDATVPDDYYLVTQSLYCDLPESWTLNITDDVGNLNEARFAVKESSVQTSVFGTVVTGGGWHHLVGVRTTTEIQIYVDGVLRSSIPDGQPGQTILSSSNISIGSAICVATEDTNGTIDEVRLSTGTRSPDWIQTTYNSLTSPGTFFTLGPEDASPPTAVELSRFSAFSAPGGIRLEWETASEVSNLGFHLHRAPSADGPFERITPALIAGLGSAPQGKEYRYFDEDVIPGPVLLRARGHRDRWLVPAARTRLRGRER